MTENKTKKALIYCRVSAVKQKLDGNGLDSQEHRCRVYAASRALEVEQVFGDNRTGGGDFMERPGMVALLDYLDQHPDNAYVVIFDDLKRFARDTIFHLKLRQTLAAYNVSVECLNFKFDDSPEGEFIETIIAAQGQLERKQNYRQTLQKMRARLERGFSVFYRPYGYRYEKGAGGGKVLVPDGHKAEIVREAYEGFASGRFSTQSAVATFLEAQPEFPHKTAKGKVRFEEVKRLLSRPIYAGILEAAQWGVTPRQGQHQPLISIATYRLVQQRMTEQARVPARKDLNRDFVMRGAVICGCCSTPLTGCWAKGRSAKYAYYHCPKSGCEVYGKSIKRDLLEGEFAALLATLQPSRSMVETAIAIFRDFWEQQAAVSAELTRRLKGELKRIEEQIADLLERVVDAPSALVMGAFEKRIHKLAGEKLANQERIATCAQPKRSFDDTLTTALSFLAKPATLWASEHYEDKRAVLKLVFGERLRYIRGQGFLEPKVALPFKWLGHLTIESAEVAEREGFEPSMGF